MTVLDTVPVLGAAETVHRIGARVHAGTACTGCGASYWACTDAVLREKADPAASDGCCHTCRDQSGHTVRTLDQVIGLLAETAAAEAHGRDTERAWVRAWADEALRSLPRFRTPDTHGKAELLRTLTGALDRRAATPDPDPAAVGPHREDPR